VLKLIDQWRQGKLETVEATAEAMQRYNTYLKDGMGSTAWVGGCQSWYLDADGDPALWPYSWDQWVKEMAEPDLADFQQGTPPERELPVDNAPAKQAA